MSILFPDQEDNWGAIASALPNNKGIQQLYQQQQSQLPVTYGSLDEAIKKAIADQSPLAYQPTPYVNPNSLIPSQYTQEQGNYQSSEDSFAPMRMFQSMQKSAPVGSSNPVATTQFGGK